MALKRVLLAGLLACGSFATAAEAEEVSISGCARAGVEAMCIVLKSGGQTYDITAATPAPEVGTFGTVTGTISQDATTCMQGTLLSPAKWVPDPKMVCTEDQ